jgi:hypothetical protein
MPIVLTVDQQSSRRNVDRVPHALRLLARVPVLRPFERTAGDEFQGVLDDATAVVDATVTLIRDRLWSIGIGCGPVEGPLPTMTRAGRGPAFLAARQAIDAAKQRPQRLAVRAAGPAGPLPARPLPTLPVDGALDAAGHPAGVRAKSGAAPDDLFPCGQDAADGEAVLTLLAALLERRSEAGWEAIDAVASAGSITKAAHTLGVTRQAIGQRLATAHVQAELAARTTAARLLLRCLSATEEDRGL